MKDISVFSPELAASVLNMNVFRKMLLWSSALESFKSNMVLKSFVLYMVSFLLVFLTCH